MSDLSYQKFSNRIDSAVADGTLTEDEARLAKAALEGGGMGAALEALKSSRLAEAEATPAVEDDAAPAPDSGPDDARVGFAEDLADLRDELNRELGSAAALDLIRKIADATSGRAMSEGAPGA